MGILEVMAEDSTWKEMERVVKKVCDLFLYFAEGNVVFFRMDFVKVRRKVLKVRFNLDLTMGFCRGCDLGKHWDRIMGN